MLLFSWLYRLKKATREWLYTIQESMALLLCSAKLLQNSKNAIPIRNFFYNPKAVFTLST